MPIRRKGGRRKTRKRVPWAGWGKQQPKGHQRTVMYKKCGRKCFLGPAKRPHPSFPICTKGTCRVNTKGVYAQLMLEQNNGVKNDPITKARVAQV